MNANVSSRVLHDVVVRGHLSLQRPRGPAGPAAPAPGVQGETGLRAAPVQQDEEARRRGYEEGFAKGRAEGQAQGAEEASRRADQAERDRAVQTERLTAQLKQEAEAAFEARLAQLNQLLAALPPQIEARLEAAEDDLLSLCFDVVCRLLGENAVRPPMLEAQVAQARAAMRSRPPAAIHLHPDDLTALQEVGAAPADGVAQDGIQWIASTEVVLGGCILQSPDGGLDARLETQLQGLKELLLRSRAVARASPKSAPRADGVQR